MRLRPGEEEEKDKVKAGRSGLVLVRGKSS